MNATKITDNIIEVTTTIPAVAEKQAKVRYNVPDLFANRDRLAARKAALDQEISDNDALIAKSQELGASAEVINPAPSFAARMSAEESARSVQP